ncbi:hypothetical protein PV326_012020, partial [Microctonus aethiopoides]
MLLYGSKYCNDESNCGDTEVCEYNRCKSTCSKLYCDDYERHEGCQYQSDGTVKCECLPKFARNSTSHVCEERGCSSDDDCDNHRVCRIINNIPKCEIVIQSPPNGCLKDNDCLMSEKCENGKCIDVCSKLECGLYEGCLASKHTASCKCAPGHILNPETNLCQRWCGGTTCGGNKHIYSCVDKCNNVTCGENEICQVDETNNTHLCECKSGYVRNHQNKCVKKVGLTCSHHKDCHFSEVCMNGICRSACSDLKCDNINQFTLNACLAYDHAATCACKSYGFY